MLGVNRRRYVPKIETLAFFLFEASVSILMPQQGQIRAFSQFTLKIKFGIRGIRLTPLYPLVLPPE